MSEPAGSTGRVARLAEAAFGRLDAEQQAVARRILLRLAGEDVGGAAVRRRVALDELEADRDVACSTCWRRRLVTRRETVEVAHEALLREWPRLRGWLEEDAEGRRLHHRLADAARDWEAGGGDPGELYRGADWPRRWTGAPSTAPISTRRAIPVRRNYRSPR